MLSKLLKVGAPLALAALLLTGGLPWCWSTDPAPEPVADPEAKAIKPYLIWSGTDSRVRQPHFARVTNSDQWGELWLSHHGGNRPEIDFGQCQVVAVFLGTSVNRRPVQLISATETAERITLRFASPPYRPGIPETLVPYGLFLLPASAKPVVIEEEVRPDVYQLRAKIEGLPSEPVLVRPVVDATPKGIKQRLQAILELPNADTKKRVLVLEAIHALREQRAELVLQFRAPQPNMQAKSQFHASVEALQKQASLATYNLSIEIDGLERNQPDDTEPEAWLHAHNYVRARLLARIAFLQEYNAQLGKLRQEWPPLDPRTEQGWQLVASEKYNDGEAAKYASRAHKILSDLVPEEAPAVRKGLKWTGWPH